jgi:integrase
MYVHTVVRWVRTQLPDGIARSDVDARLEQARTQVAQRDDLLPQTKRRYATYLALLQAFSLFQTGHGQPRPDPWALPPQLEELPEWLRAPLRRYLRLRQRQWTVERVQQRTRNLVGALCTILSFFLTRYHFKDWSELSLRWVDAYIEVGLQRGHSPSTLNGVLFPLQMFCRFLCDEGYPVPQTLTRFKTLDLPHRLPRPLTDEQVHRLERTIQAASSLASNTGDRQQAVMDLAWFYLLWHCGLRLSEAQRLAVKDLDLDGRKLLVRNSKERKDRVVYLSDMTVATLRQHLSTRPDSQAT